MITDMDMLPMNRSYYTENIKSFDNSKFIYLRENICFEYNQLAMCYNVAVPKIWSEIFEINSLEDIKNRIKTIGRHVEWCTDQLVLYKRVMAWNNKTNNLICLKENTDIPYRLILIDDKSTDPKINLFLKAQVKAFKNAILISNDQNLGFVKSANKGFSLVKSEFFILLNSDTQVPKNWLSRMIRPLVLESKLASVTPFSNEATIFSFPDDKLNKNELYRNLSISEIDQAFIQLPLLNSVIRVPTTVGFCMGIRSKCVHQVGFFDEIFGRGYGEENDWCMRATKAGFYHGAVNNLYVYHKMKGSFLKEEKLLLLKENLRILNKKYPTYSILINDFYKQDPLRYIKDLADFLLPNSANNILIFDHDMGGGANVYRNDLIETLLSQNNQVILITDNRISGHMSVVFYTKRHKLSTRLGDPRLLRKLFELFSIDEVIYNNAVNSRNPIGLINEILKLQKIFKFKINTLVHDFFPICPSYTLIDKDGKYCGVPENIDTCVACIKKLNPTCSASLVGCSGSAIFKSRFNKSVSIILKKNK
jgi:GT2 family glycosyltransferase